MSNALKANIVEEALNSCRITYYKVDSMNGSIFFCTFSNQMTFNLFIHHNDTIRLWRFVQSNLPSEHIGTRILCHDPRRPEQVAGFEITDERILNCFLEQKVGYDNSRAVFLIVRMLALFFSLIQDSDGSHSSGRLQD